ncbi:MAG: DUF4157 domain-containing protein, partial [Myxococcota bacterium]
MDHLESKVQMSAGPGGESHDALHEAAICGTSGGGGTLPHLKSIQTSFGRHDVSNVQAYTNAAASAACAFMGAEAYATGNKVAFGDSPSLHTAAHEAAHVVQQRVGVSLRGGVGQVGDRYEQHADAVADAVVHGRSAEAILDNSPGMGSAKPAGAVQRQDKSKTWNGQDTTIDSRGQVGDEAGSNAVTRVMIRGFQAAQDSMEVVVVLPSQKSIADENVSTLDVLLHYHGGGAQSIE